MFQLPSVTGVREVVVDEASVEGSSTPKLRFPARSPWMCRVGHVGVLRSRMCLTESVQIEG